MIGQIKVKIAALHGGLNNSWLKLLLDKS